MCRICFCVLWVSSVRYRHYVLFCVTPHSFCIDSLLFCQVLLPLLEAACDALKTDASDRLGELEAVIRESVSAAEQWASRRDIGGPKLSGDKEFATT